jgi:hypothetical protein
VFRSLFSVVQEKAVGVRVARVAKMKLAFMAIPLGVSALLWSPFVPAVPTPPTENAAGSLILSLHWEVEECEASGRSWVPVVALL